MLYIITFIIFLAWNIWVIRQGTLSWHAIINIYVVTLFVVDFGDVPLEHWFGFYNLPVQLINEPYDDYLGIVFSDGLIFPLIAIVFCYYFSRYHRPWLLSILFALLMGGVEAVYVKFGYMIYKYWASWTTAAITLILFRILAQFAVRFVYYTPPIPYWLWLLSCVYVISEWPGALLAGIMRLYHYRPHIFNDDLADDRFVAMILAITMGGLAALFAPKFGKKYKLFFFLGLGVVSIAFAVGMLERQLLIYQHWNNILTISRYILPYLVIYWVDRWESSYRQNVPLE